MIQGEFKMKIFCKLVCLLAVLFYLGCKQEEPQNPAQPPGDETTNEGPSTPAPPIPEGVPTIKKIEIPSNSPATPSPTVTPSTPSPPAPQRIEEGLKVIEFVDRKSQDKFVGLKQKLPTGQIALLMIDNEKSWALSWFSDIGAMVSAVRDIIVENTHYDRKLVDFICEQTTDSARESAFVQSALKFRGGATLAIINPEDGSAQTYMGSAMGKPSDYKNHIIISVLIRDQMIQRVVMTDVVNTDKQLSYLNRAVNPNEDVPEAFEEVDLIRYITTLERIKGPSLDFPVCNPQPATPSQPSPQTQDDGGSSDTPSS